MGPHRADMLRLAMLPQLGVQVPSGVNARATALAGLIQWRR
jgi:hypothetical protein